MFDLIQDVLFPSNYHNNSGIYQIHYVPVDWAESISINGSDANVTLISGKNWTLLESTRISAGLTIDPDEDDNGDFYTSKVPGHLPLKTSQITQLFEFLSKLHLVVRVTDNNGNQRLIGNLTEAAEFKLKQFNTVGLPGSREGYSWEIRCVSATLPPHL